MPWREVYLRFMGIIQSQEGIRRTAHIIHCSLVDKPVPPTKLWPLPFDGDEGYSSAIERLKQKQLELKRNGG